MILMSLALAQSVATGPQLVSPPVVRMLPFPKTGRFECLIDSGVSPAIRLQGELVKDSSEGEEPGVMAKVSAMGIENLSGLYRVRWVSGSLRMTMAYADTTLSPSLNILLIHEPKMQEPGQAGMAVWLKNPVGTRIDKRMAGVCTTTFPASEQGSQK